MNEEAGPQGAGDTIGAVGALAEPVRRALYDYVASQGEVSRAQAAQAVGLSRNLAAFHLDKLVEAGLLDVGRRKLSGREGPGSGRPAKLYRRSRHRHRVHLPPSDHEGAAGLLAQAVEAAGAEGELFAAARDEGRRRGAALVRQAEDAARPLAAVAQELLRRGYEPAGEHSAALVLRNCPFHELALRFPPVACGMNLALITGLLEGAGCAEHTARLAPESGRCCVAISKTNSI